MATETKTLLTVQALVLAPIQKVWECWTSPQHIVGWNAASDDWHTTQADNDLKVGGKFLFRMESKDGSMGFDFWGTYAKIESGKFIEIKLGDGRFMSVSFEVQEGSTIVTEIFEAEEVNSTDLQKTGWQAILDNFKKYTEARTMR